MFAAQFGLSTERETLRPAGPVVCSSLGHERHLQPASPPPEDGGSQASPAPDGSRATFAAFGSPLGAQARAGVPPPSS